MWEKLRSINLDNYGDLQMLPSSDHSFHMHGALHGDCDMHALWQMSAFARSQKKKKGKKKPLICRLEASDCLQRPAGGGHVYIGGPNAL